MPNMTLGSVHIIVSSSCLFLSKSKALSSAQHVSLYL